jgi:hypothetical protein
MSNYVDKNGMMLDAEEVEQDISSQADCVADLEQKLAASEAARKRAEQLIEHLEHWQNLAGQTYDLTNPEAQVQPVIDAMVKAEDGLNVMRRQRDTLAALVSKIGDVACGDDPKPRSVGEMLGAICELCDSHDTAAILADHVRPLVGALTKARALAQKLDYVDYGLREELKRLLDAALAPYKKGTEDAPKD